MMVKGALTARIRGLLMRDNLPSEVRDVLAETAIVLEMQVEAEGKIEAKIDALIPFIVSRLVPPPEEKPPSYNDVIRSACGFGSGPLGSNGCG
jgi:hypothetical protein